MFYEFPARCAILISKSKPEWSLYNPYIPSLLRGDRDNWGWMKRELPAWQSHRVNARQGLQAQPAEPAEQ